jgi:hypothetical protein
MPKTIMCIVKDEVLTNIEKERIRNMLLQIDKEYKRRARHMSYNKTMLMFFESLFTNGNASETLPMTKIGNWDGPTMAGADTIPIEKNDLFNFIDMVNQYLENSSNVSMVGTWIRPSYIMRSSPLLIKTSVDNQINEAESSIVITSLLFNIWNNARLINDLCEYFMAHDTEFKSGQQQVIWDYLKMVVKQTPIA